MDAQKPSSSPNRIDDEQKQCSKIRKAVKRTTCACRLCSIGCVTMPGSLIPGDLQAIEAHLNVAEEDKREFRLTHFLASHMLIMRDNNLAKVATLVPAMQLDSKSPTGNSCVFLKDGKCSIHPVSPFNCAMQDDHMSEGEANSRSRIAAVTQIQAEPDGVYLQTHLMLTRNDKVAPAIQIRRENYEAQRRQVLLDIQQEDDIAEKERVNRFAALRRSRQDESA